MEKFPSLKKTGKAESMLYKFTANIAPFLDVSIFPSRIVPWPFVVYVKIPTTRTAQRTFKAPINRIWTL